MAREKDTKADRASGKSKALPKTKELTATKSQQKVVGGAGKNYPASICSC